MSVCLSTRGYPIQPWIGGTYLGWGGGTLSLDRGYLPWPGGYIPWNGVHTWNGGTYLRLRVSTLDRVPTLDGGTYLGPRECLSVHKGVPHSALDGGHLPWIGGYSIPGQGIPTLDRGYIPWMGVHTFNGGTYPRWGTYLGQEGT